LIVFVILVVVVVVVVGVVVVVVREGLTVAILLAPLVLWGSIS